MTTSRSSRPWLRPVRTKRPAELSDEELISAVLAGDDRVTATLYDRLHKTIERSLYRVFGRRETDHDDLVQAVFEQVIVTLVRGSYSGNCSLKTWSARISSNVALNALRSRRRERNYINRSVELSADGGVGVGSSIAPPMVVDAEGQSNARAMLKIVMGELAEMNQRRAQAVLLHDIEGYDLEEIASMTEVTVAAAQSRLVRGRKELLKRLEAHEKRARLRRTIDPDEFNREGHATDAPKGIGDRLSPPPVGLVPGTQTHAAEALDASLTNAAVVNTPAWGRAHAAPQTSAAPQTRAVPQTHAAPPISRTQRDGTEGEEL